MTPQQIKEWRSDDAMYDSAFAALYYPWIKVENPIGVNGDREVFVPPSGHIAGLWARTDETRGVWKAPANDTIRGCLDVERAITQNEQSLLNPIGINCIRPFGTRGIRVWGARTLVVRLRLALHQRAPAVQHDRVLDHGGHPVGGVRAQRRDAVGGRQAHADRRSCAGCGRPVRSSVPRRTRRSTSSATPRPTRRSRSTPGKLVVEVGHRSGQAGRVRGLPDQPAEAGRGLRHAASPTHQLTQHTARSARA